MNSPPSAVKIRTKKGKCVVEYTNNVERAKYSLQGLTYTALRDVGKFVAKTFRSSYYQNFKRRTGRVGRYAGYWARKQQLDLQVGIKKNAFYGGFQETGTSKTQQLGLLESAVKDNIAEIVKIESQYLSALEDEAKALAMIESDDEVEGTAEDE